MDKMLKNFITNVAIFYLNLVWRLCNQQLPLIRLQAKEG